MLNHCVLTDSIHFKSLVFSRNLPLVEKCVICKTSSFVHILVSITL